jgi:nitroreductase
MTAIEAIKIRYSVRTYSDKPIVPDDKEILRTSMRAQKSGPFGGAVRFELVEITEDERRQLKELVSYGMIKGAHAFIAGAVKKGEHAMEDYGYCLERIILAATGAGLGTCWLGGTFKRSAFSKKINAADDEIVPAVTPVGYTVENVRLRDSLVRFAVGAKRRKPFRELFFDGAFKLPLSFNEMDIFHRALECVRLAPSASNKQPWRTIKENDRSTWHFYIKEDARYTTRFKEIKIQSIDMGIAMCHFELALAQLGQGGSWRINDPRKAIDADDLKYVASWVVEDTPCCTGVSSHLFRKEDRFHADDKTL